jgi:hypothetical protein
VHVNLEIGVLCQGLWTFYFDLMVILTISGQSEHEHEPFDLKMDMAGKTHKGVST